MFSSRYVELNQFLLIVVILDQSVGADVNQRVFRGYPTAAVREGHLKIVEVLIGCGASQEACEEALLEASYLGLARPAEMLMASEMIRSRAAVHALVSASSRGFADVVCALLKVFLLKFTGIYSLLESL